MSDDNSAFTCDADREPGVPCGQPATYRTTAEAGDVYLACAEHSVVIRKRIPLPFDDQHAEANPWCTCIRDYLIRDLVDPQCPLGTAAEVCLTYGIPLRSEVDPWWIGKGESAQVPRYAEPDLLRALDSLNRDLFGGDDA